LGVTGWERLGVEIVQAMIWSCLALAVPLADVSLNWREIRSILSRSAKTTVSEETSVPARIRRAA